MRTIGVGSICKNVLNMSILYELNLQLAVRCADKINRRDHQAKPCVDYKCIAQ